MKLSQFIEQSNGKFLTVTFVKKDGTIRTINGRLGVKKYLAGGKSTLDANQYITIYSNKDEGYRAINKDTIQSVTIEGITMTNNKLEV
jgi:hypothetical protein